MAKKCSTGRSSDRIRSFVAIWQQLLAISTWIFEKVAPEDLAILAGTTPKPGFLASHEPRNHTGEKREGRGERGEEKRTAGTHNFYIAYFEIVSERQKSARDTPLGHLNRAVPFSKIRVYIGIKWAKMAKKCSTGRSSARIRSFVAIWQQLLAISTWIFEKVAPEDLAILAGTTPKPGFLASHEPRNHTGEKREGRGERGEEKRTAGTHNFYIAYFEIVSERQKSACDTPLGHLNRAVPFSKIRVYIYIYIYSQSSPCDHSCKRPALVRTSIMKPRLTCHLNSVMKSSRKRPLP